MTAKQVLRECPVFAALADAELEKVASLVVEKEYEAGTTIFREGDSAEELFVLREGKVVVQMAMPTVPGQASRKVTVDIVTRNELLGWSAIVEPHVYTLTAVCLQKTKVLSISSREIRALLRDNDHMGYEILGGLIKVVATRLDDTIHVLVSERLLASKSG